MNHVDTEVARGVRRCKRNRNHIIRKGEPCLMIQDLGTPYRKSYCRECAFAILKQCGADLRNIRDVLYPELSPKLIAQPEPDSSKQPAKLSLAR